MLAVVPFHHGCRKFLGVSDFFFCYSVCCRRFGHFSSGCPTTLSAFRTFLSAIALLQALRSLFVRLPDDTVGVSDFFFCYSVCCRRFGHFSSDCPTALSASSFTVTFTLSTLRGSVSMTSKLRLAKSNLSPGRASRQAFQVQSLLPYYNHFQNPLRRNP